MMLPNAQGNPTDVSPDETQLEEANYEQY